MGFHSYLQSKHIPFESALATGINYNIFQSIAEAADRHQESLPESSYCPMAIQAGTRKRNIVSLAVAPTMSISNLCNLASSGIEPWMSNAFSKKLKQGTFAVRNKYLQILLDHHALTNRLPNSWIEEQWSSIKKYEGSVQHLDWMSDYDKEVFKTAYEIDQRWIVEHAGSRTEYIDQGQSVNLFVPGDSHVQYISDLHMLAWKKGLKSLYYLRSTNPNRATTASKDRQTIATTPMYDECLSCQ